jgi:hypothetical protein
MIRSFAQAIAARTGKQKRLQPALEALETRVVPSALTDVPLAFTNVHLLNAAFAQTGYPVKSTASFTPSGG